MIDKIINAAGRIEDLMVEARRVVRKCKTNLKILYRYYTNTYIQIHAKHSEY